MTRDAAPAVDAAEVVSPEPAVEPAAAPAAAPLLRVGQLAEAVGLSHRTVRYYDDQGLLSARRSAGNYRLYEPADVDRMRAVMAMKPLGFSLEEMRQLLDALEGRVGGGDGGSDGGGGDGEGSAAVLARFRGEVAARRARLAEHLALADALGERLAGALDDGSALDAT